MVRDLIEKGLRAHQAGRLAEARAVYEQVLALQPRHPDALHLTGVVALQAGDASSALAFIRKAIEVQPRNAAFHGNLGQVYLELSQVAEAHDAFRKASRLDPGNPHFAVSAANCLALQGRLAEAERQLRRVTQTHPGFAFAWLNLGNAIQEQGRAEEAIEPYRRSLQLEPGSPDALNSLGRSLHSLERFAEAEQAYRQSLSLQPDSIVARCNLASVLIDRGRFEEAESVCRPAARIDDPRAGELSMMLGSALAHQGRFTAALDAFRRAADLGPRDPRAQWAYGFAVHATGNPDQGIARMEAALALDPDAISIRGALSAVRRARGDFAAGWRDYETRPSRLNFLSENPQLHPVLALAPDLSNSRVCLLGEQGLGDELFFLRFVPLLKSRGADVAYIAGHKLVSMLGRVPLLDQVIPRGQALPEFDIAMLIGDLPVALGHEATPAPLPLSALPSRLDEMRERLHALGRPPFLGVTWRGGTAPERQLGASWSHFKRVPLEGLGAALQEVEGTLLALQRLPEDGEVAHLAARVGRPVHDFTALNEDLEGMLALLSLLDDYVGVSNANMHLRAGVGRTARVLVPQPAEWRWMSAGDESPWFPGFRIYRQAPDGDWRDALSRLERDLMASRNRGAE